MMLQSVRIARGRGRGRNAIGEHGAARSNGSGDLGWSPRLQRAGPWRRVVGRRWLRQQPPCGRRGERQGWSGRRGHGPLRPGGVQGGCGIEQDPQVMRMPADACLRCGRGMLYRRSAGRAIRQRHPLRRRLPRPRQRLQGQGQHHQPDQAGKPQGERTRGGAHEPGYYSDGRDLRCNKTFRLQPW